MAFSFWGVFLWAKNKEKQHNLKFQSCVLFGGQNIKGIWYAWDIESQMAMRGSSKDVKQDLQGFLQKRPGGQGFKEKLM